MVHTPYLAMDVLSSAGSGFFQAIASVLSPTTVREPGPQASKSRYSGPETPNICSTIPDPALLHASSRPHQAHKARSPQQLRVARLLQLQDPIPPVLMRIVRDSASSVKVGCAPLDSGSRTGWRTDAFEMAAALEAACQKPRTLEDNSSTQVIQGLLHAFLTTPGAAAAMLVLGSKHPESPTASALMGTALAALPQGLGGFSAASVTSSLKRRPWHPAAHATLAAEMLRIRSLAPVQAESRPFLDAGEAAWLLMSLLQHDSIASQAPSGLPRTAASHTPTHAMAATLSASVATNVPRRLFLADPAPIWAQEQPRGEWPRGRQCRGTPEASGVPSPSVDAGKTRSGGNHRASRLPLHPGREGGERPVWVRESEAAERARTCSSWMPKPQLRESLACLIKAMRASHLAASTATAAAAGIPASARVRCCPPSGMPSGAGQKPPTLPPASFPQSPDGVRWDSAAIRAQMHSVRVSVCSVEHAVRVPSGLDELRGGGAGQQGTAEAAVSAADVAAVVDDLLQEPSRLPPGQDLTCIVVGNRRILDEATGLVDASIVRCVMPPSVLSRPALAAWLHTRHRTGRSVDKDDDLSDDDPLQLVGVVVDAALFLGPASPVRYVTFYNHSVWNAAAGTTTAARGHATNSGASGWMALASQGWPVPVPAEAVPAALGCAFVYASSTANQGSTVVCRELAEVPVSDDDTATRSLHALLARLTHGRHERRKVAPNAADSWSVRAPFQPAMAPTSPSLSTDSFASDSAPADVVEEAVAISPTFAPYGAATPRRGSTTDSGAAASEAEEGNPSASPYWVPGCPVTQRGVTVSGVVACSLSTRTVRHPHLLFGAGPQGESYWLLRYVPAGGALQLARRLPLPTRPPTTPALGKPILPGRASPYLLHRDWAFRVGARLTSAPSSSMGGRNAAPEAKSGPSSDRDAAVQQCFVRPRVPAQSAYSAQAVSRMSPTRRVAHSLALYPASGRHDAAIGAAGPGAAAAAQQGGGALTPSDALEARAARRLRLGAEEAFAAEARRGALARAASGAGGRLGAAAGSAASPTSRQRLDAARAAREQATAEAEAARRVYEAAREAEEAAGRGAGLGAASGAGADDAHVGADDHGAGTATWEAARRRVDSTRAEWVEQCRAAAAEEGRERAEAMAVEAEYEQRRLLDGLVVAATKELDRGQKLIDARMEEISGAAAVVEAVMKQSRVLEEQMEEQLASSRLWAAAEAAAVAENVRRAEMRRQAAERERQEELRRRADDRKQHDAELAKLTATTEFAQMTADEQAQLMAESSDDETEDAAGAKPGSGRRVLTEEERAWLGHLVEEGQLLLDMDASEVQAALAARMEAPSLQSLQYTIRSDQQSCFASVRAVMAAWQRLQADCGGRAGRAETCKFARMVASTMEDRFHEYEVDVVAGDGDVMACLCTGRVVVSCCAGVPGLWQQLWTRATKACAAVGPRPCRQHDSVNFTDKRARALISGLVGVLTVGTHITCGDETWIMPAQGFRPLDTRPWTPEPSLRYPCCAAGNAFLEANAASDRLDREFGEQLWTWLVRCVNICCRTDAASFHPLLPFTIATILHIGGFALARRFGDRFIKLLHSINGASANIRKAVLDSVKDNSVGAVFASSIDKSIKALVGVDAAGKLGSRLRLPAVRPEHFCPPLVPT